jgi:YHS domain-containing protein
MFKRTMLVVCMGVFFFGATRELLFGQEAQNDTMTHATVQQVEAGNQICPVSGEKVGQSGMEIVKYEYEGKIYNFCCAACIEEFKKDPDKYVKIVEEEKGNNTVNSGHSH